MLKAGRLAIRMNVVKTYQKINDEERGINFGISKTEDTYTKRNGKVDEPHRHNYYTVLIIKKAKGQHKIDFNSYDLSERQIYFVAPGQVHRVIEEEKSQGFAITFSNEFLIQNSIPLSFIASLTLFQNYGQSPPLLPSPEQFKIIEKFTNHIFSLFNSDAKMKLLSVGAYQGSVITKDHAVNVLIKLGDVETYSDSAFTLLVEQLSKCPSNQVPMYAERAISVVNSKNKSLFVKTLNSRVDDFEKETQRKRVEKVLKKVSQPV